MFLDIRYMKVVRLSALRIGRWVVPRGYNGGGMFKKMKIPKDPIGNQTRDLPAYSAVLQPNVPPLAPNHCAINC